MRILVAGGGGFIGSHLVDRFLDRGDEVVVLDSFSTGRHSNLEHRSGHDGCQVVECDITEPLPGLGEFEAVVNLASPASPEDFASMPLEILQAGSVGNRHLLDLATDCGARFLLASTSEVYGDSLVHPQSEDYRGNVDPIGPRSCYDEAKRFAEATTMAYARRRGLDIRIARIFNTYGERMMPTDGRVVGAFIVQALREEPLRVFGDGTQTRSFCHVADQVVGGVGRGGRGWVPRACGPVDYLDRVGWLRPGLIVVHGVQLTDAELALLVGRGVTLVTCPRSNVWTGVGPPPIDRFIRSGVRLALGTDSLASAPDLNLFAELELMRRLAPSVSARRLLACATIRGAEALGFADELGQIAPGRRAALIAVRVPRDVSDVEEYLVGGIAPDQVTWLEDPESDTATR